jgi:hypothetical protein
LYRNPDISSLSISGSEFRIPISPFSQSDSLKSPGWLSAFLRMHVRSSVVPFYKGP